MKVWCHSLHGVFSQKVGRYVAQVSSNCLATIEGFAIIELLGIPIVAKVACLWQVLTIDFQVELLGIPIVAKVACLWQVLAINFQV
jgi:hypothetical protein